MKQSPGGKHFGSVITKFSAILEWLFSSGQLLPQKEKETEKYVPDC